MRAAVLKGPGTVEIQDVPRQEPAPGEVRIRMHGSGVCGSDMAAWQGRSWLTYPMDPGAPGHEGWGIVDALGENVHGIETGTPVAAISHRAFAAYDVAPAAAVVPLPDHVVDSPFPGEAVACGLNVAARSEVSEGTTVAIVGIGFLGAIVTQAAVAAGGRVIAISRRGFSREIAQWCGAKEAVPLDETATERVREITGGAMCDVAIEAAGRQETLDVASQLVKVRGRLVIAGYHQDGPRNINLQDWNWRGLDVINAHERELSAYVSGIKAAVAAVTQGDLSVAPLVTHRFSLNDISSAFDAAQERRDGFLKAVVMP